MVFNKFCLIGILLLASVSQVATAQEATLSKEEKKEGFKPLFNGKNLKGWHSYLRDDPKDPWMVDSGAIFLSKSGGGDLVTNKEYTNFIFRFEWKISRGGNSGVFYKVNENIEYKVAYLTGIEYQVLDNKRHKDGALPSHRAGAVYDLFPLADTTTPQPGQWHSGEIGVNGNAITHKLDGVVTAEYALDSPEFQAKLKASKFATWSAFAKATKGRLALQDHGDKVWFRNLRLKELK